ncbi:hypothetical protein TcasGA2_TC007414 [Tribolium castaneum]|uniref:Uncharacterized protein n=1 Tax=Tribolium castaneum TaxID=7070 RepID=D1ZZQ5_TRICA|nr:hypothetical protein TcasGA2_TC007414 [Tribolium castaneum]
MTCRWFRANRPAATVKHGLQWVTRAERVTRRIHKSSLQQLTSDGYEMFDTEIHSSFRDRVVVTQRSDRQYQESKSSPDAEPGKARENTRGSDPFREFLRADTRF